MSELRVIGAPDGALRPWLFARIRESRAAGRPVVLFVPEQYTLQAERDLLTALRLKGLLDLDVLSPTRLRSLIRERAGGSGRAALDEAGRAMALHQALHECASSLTCYGRLADLYGAVSRMDHTLSELREENLTADSLEAMAEASSGALKAKYQDLSRIWRSYDSLLGERFEDPASAWRDACARLPASGLLRGADLYVYGFDTVRPDLRELLLAAAPLCASLQVLLVMTDASSPTGRVYRVQRDSAAGLLSAAREKGIDGAVEFLPVPPAAPGDPLAFLRTHVFSESEERFSGNPGPAVTLHAASHPTAESLTVVSVLRRWHEEGIPWNRMAIALPSGAAGSEALYAALRRHRIPFFLSRRESLGRHGVSQLLSGALTCVSGGLDTEPLLRMACCGFGTLTREEGALLTDYARTWGIRYQRWRRPFTRGENAEEAEALRRRLLEPLDQLHAALREARTGEESAAAVFAFLREEDIYAQLAARRERLMAEERYAEAIVDRQVWDLLLSLLDQLHALLGGRRAALREISDLLRGALERASLAALPEEEDGVAVGRIGHMLPGRTEALVLPGMNDGVLSASSDSLLSDQERKSLEEKEGRPLGMNQARMSRIIRSDYARTLSLPEKRLHVSFCLRDEGGRALLPGEPVAELKRLFPDLREEGGLSEDAAASLPASPDLALEIVGPLLRDLKLGLREPLPEAWQAAVRSLLRDESSAALFRRMLALLTDRKAPGQIPSASAIRLFQGGRVSVSRLECFAACPRQHFLRYGLRPVLPVSFEFTAGDAGNFYHAALERYINRASREPGWPRLDPDRVSALMDEVLSDLVLPWEEGPLREDAVGRWQGEEILRRARRAASVLTRFAANGDFQVIGTEMAFGEPGGMPPLILRLPDGAEIALRGKIDRLDRYRGAEGDYLRVLDMKSSVHELIPARMDAGEQLQLMIYLLAALQGSPGALPAGALYFPVQDAEVKSTSPESAEADRLKNVQFKGIALAEESVLRAMDRDISPFSLPKVINQDGSFSKSAGWVVPEETLRRLMTAARDKAAELCVRIRSGQVAASPSVYKDAAHCAFCEFREICPVRKSDQRPLPEGMRFEDVGREEGRPGVG